MEAGQVRHKGSKLDAIVSRPLSMEMSFHPLSQACYQPINLTSLQTPCTSTITKGGWMTHFHTLKDRPYISETRNHKLDEKQRRNNILIVSSF